MRALPIILVLLVSTIAVDAGATYAAPRRSIRQLTYAIGTTRPELPEARRRALAKMLLDVAKRHNFDPLSGWAIIDHESRWRANAIGPDGEDIGLAQIRYTEHAACRRDRSSPGCAARRAALMDPAVNMAAMGAAISAWRSLCTKVTGKAPDMRHWLAGYGGYSRPEQNIYCSRRKVRSGKGWRWQELKTPKAVEDILAARKAMIRQLQRDAVK